MPKTMLIDATHSEETRVAVVDGNRLVEFDYESKVRKQLKGGIFLAKVTRVEPSLQAAFVNFGGNRHGFLPFSEIHPDYFRIPIADREALLAAQIAELEEHDEEMEQQEAGLNEEGESESDSSEDEDEEEYEEDVVVEVGGEDQPLIDDEHEDGETAEVAAAAPDVNEEQEETSKKKPSRRAMKAKEDVIEGPETEEQAEEGFADESGEAQDEDLEEERSFNENEEGDEPSGDEGEEASASGEDGVEGEKNDRRGNRGRGNRDRGRGRGRGRNGQGRGRSRGRDDDQSVESLGGDGIESDRPFRFNMRKNYKIQEVIKRGQIMLIQVSKEERGNKGAAVTTYLSLPGRYCVLMPNSPRGGGVSRKIASFKDRKRMKDMLDDLSVPDGMSVILRTAGVARTKVEIKRDLDYLTRLWNTIREHTLQSSAPALIYEEGNLIKRAIRDLYGRDIDDVLVQGDDGYKAAKEFMKMLMPSHAKKVQEYKDTKTPLFHKYNVENQITDIGEPTVNLKSGGYLVINPTEALVSIDVNSGRATKERHIEETALKTNLEAADELARQLRLRDLGGLVVVDFIDMEDRRNNRKVEQRLRDALSTDRARIQVGRISSFGLLELSRQRLNPSLSEAQTEICQHCAGIGRVRTLDFSAISIIRALEAEGIKGKCNEITLTMGTNVALYILNNKRRILNEIEERYGMVIRIETDDHLSNTQFNIEAAMRADAPKIEGIRVAKGGYTEVSDDEIADEEIMEDAEEENASSAQSPRQPRERDENGDDEGGRRRRRGRRGGRGRGRREDGDAPSASEGQPDAENSSNENEGGGEQSGANGEDGEQRPRRDRNRRRGGRGRGPRRDEGNAEAGEQSSGDAQQAPASDAQDRVSAPPAPEQAPRKVEVSNDSQPVLAAPAREYEVVNQAPEKKKKGWWNKLVE